MSELKAYFVYNFKIYKLTISEIFVKNLVITEALTSELIQPLVTDSPSCSNGIDSEM